MGVSLLGLFLFIWGSFPLLWLWEFQGKSPAISGKSRLDGGVGFGVFFLGFLELLPSLKHPETDIAIALENWPEISSSNHWFSGAKMLVSGSVHFYTNIPLCRWMFFFFFPKLFRCFFWTDISEVILIYGCLWSPEAETEFHQIRKVCEKKAHVNFYTIGWYFVCAFDKSLYWGVIGVQSFCFVYVLWLLIGGVIFALKLWAQAAPKCGELEIHFDSRSTSIGGANPRGCLLPRKLTAGTWKSPLWKGDSSSKPSFLGSKC